MTDEEDRDEIIRAINKSSEILAAAQTMLRLNMWPVVDELLSDASYQLTEARQYIWRHTRPADDDD